MTRIEKLLIRIRDTLADKNAERWSDERLLRLIEEGQLDLCRRAKLLRTKTELNVFDGQAEYKLPSDFLLLDKVSINGEFIPLKSYNELDKSVDKWETLTGRVSAVLFDKQMRGNIRLFPIPDYQNGNRLNIIPAFNPYYYNKIRDRYGIVANLPATAEFTNGKFGVVTGITGVFQYQEEITDIPKVFSVEYKQRTKWGGVANITFMMSEDVTQPREVGNVTSIGRTTTESFGVITGHQDNIKHQQRYSDTDGLGVEGKETPKVGYMTAFISYGDISSADGKVKMAQKYGIANLSNVNRTEIKYSSPYGITTGVTELANTMTIFYIRKPKEIINTQSELEIDNSLDSALKYYVCGKAFRDDLDAQNRAMGNEELQLYERELNSAVAEDTLSFTRDASPIYELSYNGGF